MNKFPNSAAAHRKVIIQSNNDASDGEINYEVVEELYEEEDVQDDTTTVEFEVLSEEVDIEPHKPLNCEVSNTVDQPTNAKPAQWSRPAIFYLIATYKGLARNEASGKTCYGPTMIWTELSKKLQQRGFTCTPEQCRTKWMLLKKLYQHIRNESQIEKFKFLETIHDYYKDPRIEKLLVETKRKKQKRRKQPSEHEDGEGGSRLRKLLLETKKNNQRQSKNPSEYGDGEVGSGSEELLQIKKMEFAHDDESSQTDGISEHGTSFQYGSESEETQSTEIKFEIEVDEDSENRKSPVSSEETSNDHPFMAYREASTKLLTEFRDIIVQQEQRREERHKAKLKIFREYNERLLAQQKKSIILHKQLMERLINNL